MDPGIGAPWSLETLWKYDEQAKFFYLIWFHSTKMCGFTKRACHLFFSLLRYLLGITDEERQQRREEILSTR